MNDPAVITLIIFAIPLSVMLAMILILAVVERGTRRFRKDTYQ